jgi:hypothetical protein
MPKSGSPKFKSSGLMGNVGLSIMTAAGGNAHCAGVDHSDLGTAKLVAADLHARGEVRLSSCLEVRPSALPLPAFHRTSDCCAF